MLIFLDHHLGDSAALERDVVMGGELEAIPRDGRVEATAKVNANVDAVRTGCRCNVGGQRFPEDAPTPRRRRGTIDRIRDRHELERGADVMKVDDPQPRAGSAAIAAFDARGWKGRIAGRERGRSQRNPRRGPRARSVRSHRAKVSRCKAIRAAWKPLATVRFHIGSKSRYEAAHGP